LIAEGHEFATTNGYATPLVIDGVEEVAGLAVKVHTSMGKARTADSLVVDGRAYDVISVKDAIRWRIIHAKELLYDETVTIYHQDVNGRNTAWIRMVIEAAAKWTGGQKVTVGEGLTQNDVHCVKILADKIPDTLTVNNGDVVCLGDGPITVEEAKKIRNSFVITSVSMGTKKPLPLLVLEGGKWR